MLKFLFRGLTGEGPKGVALFDVLTAEARQPHWYVQGAVPDSLDGRFAVLASLSALVLVRLEVEGAKGDALSVALTERFVHVMESEHRELGLGDPTLGKTVRRLVGMLARRTELWRAATPETWREVTSMSLAGDALCDRAKEHCAKALATFRTRIDATPFSCLERGEFR